MNTYDVAIIGSGPGGFAAAMAAVDSGRKVCIIEKDQPGGLCLNQGCIPTKTIISSINILRGIRRSSEFGIDVSSFRIDMARVISRKEEVVSRLRKGVETALKARGVDIIKSVAEISDSNNLKAGTDTIGFKYLIIATGSGPIETETLSFDHINILSSDDLLSLDHIPESLVIIGGGYIGCEFASIYSQLGTKVTIVELMDTLIPASDKEIAKRLEAFLKRSKIDIIKGKKVSSANVKDKVELELEDSVRIVADKVLLSIGRRPNAQGLGLDKIGVKTDRAKIVVDTRLRTNIENIYAVGDVIGGYSLAHVAAYEGRIAAENIAGRDSCADYSAVPSCIFTHPEIASVGMTQEGAQDSGLDISVTKLPFSAISKAHCIGDTEGIVKLITDTKTGAILGAHIIGPDAGELISGITIAMSNGIKADRLSRTIFSHPTLSEIIPETIYHIR